MGPHEVENSTLFLWQWALSVHGSRWTRRRTPRDTAGARALVFWPLEVSVWSQGPCSPFPQGPQHSRRPHWPKGLLGELWEQWRASRGLSASSRRPTAHFLSPQLPLSHLHQVIRRHLPACWPLSWLSSPSPAQQSQGSCWQMNAQLKMQSVPGAPTQLQRTPPCSQSVQAHTPHPPFFPSSPPTHTLLSMLYSPLIKSPQRTSLAYVHRNELKSSPATGGGNRGYRAEWTQAFYGHVLLLPPDRVPLQ